MQSWRRALAGWLPALALIPPLSVPLGLWAADPPLTSTLGRNDVRIWSAPYRLPVGVTIEGAELPLRLERLGYERVHERPHEPGQYFWGSEIFWIWRREHRWGGKRRPAELLRLGLVADTGEVRSVFTLERPQAEGPEEERYRSPRAAWLEPELVAESLDPDRAPRRLAHFETLPERVWRAVLAAEDARFFEHGGVDPRSLARAALSNVKAGRVTQGGSTITQQLIKVRDLTPRRSLGRKASEAARALALEAEHSKEEILEAYLDSIYFGHLGGMELYGIGAAAQAFFSKPPAALDLGEAALLAAMIQGPNGLDPVRHPDRALARQRWVLDRLEELDWAPATEIARARGGLPRLRLSPPRPLAGRHLIQWVGDEVTRAAERRSRKGRGVVVETTLDLRLQELAEDAVRDGLAKLRRERRALADRPLSAALVALDAATGEVVAWVGGDPAARDDFDRARRARRQPGSAVKPLVLLEAFEECGRKAPLHPATRVADRPLSLELPTGPWRPVNSNGNFRGTVTLREALVSSLNVPFVRAARWCGFDATARRLRRAGYALPEEPPPAFVLGAVEASPLELATAYGAIAAAGRAANARPITRLERPSGRRLQGYRPRAHRVAGAEAAYLVADLMADAVGRGTAREAALAGTWVAAKTGTSSNRRDAWLAGMAADLVCVVWVGLDDATPLDLGGGAAAAPIWRAFMERAVPSRSPVRPAEPRRIVHRWVERDTGLIVREGRDGAYEEIFRRGALPRWRRWYRSDEPEPVIE
jgi:membrane peptidoglycan carboxypeptidase